MIARPVKVGDEARVRGVGRVRVDRRWLNASGRQLGWYVVTLDVEPREFPVGARELQPVEDERGPEPHDNAGDYAGIGDDDRDVIARAVQS